MATDNPDVFAAKGAWVLTGGTGDYAGLTGQGTSLGTCEGFGTGGPEDQILEGRVR